MLFFTIHLQRRTNIPLDDRRLIRFSSISASGFYSISAGGFSAISAGGP